MLSHRLELLNKRLMRNLMNKLLGVVPTDIPIAPDQIRSILFIRNDAIGDMVLSTALWNAIKRSYPNIKIGVAGSFRNMTVIEGDPNVDVRIDLSLDSIAHTVKAIRLARMSKWDIVIPLNYGQKSKMAIFSRLMAPGASITMLLYSGTSPEYYAKLFSAIVQAPYVRGDRHMIEVMKFHLLSSIAFAISEDEWKPSLHIDPKVLTMVSLSTTSILEADGTTGYIHINLEAAMPFRELGIEKNIEVARLLLMRFPQLSVLCTCSPVSVPQMSEVIEQSNIPRLHLFPTTQTQELFALVRFSILVISPDTSVVHIASAEGKPTVGLYAHPNEWAPYRVPSRIVVPAFGEPVSAISPEAIRDAAEQLLVEAGVHSSTTASLAARI
jgi:ADP-heptose:LPS heptosyltransferase